MLRRVVVLAVLFRLWTFSEGASTPGAVNADGLHWHGPRTMETFLDQTDDDDDDMSEEQPSKESLPDHSKPPKFMLKIYEWRKRREDMKSGRTTSVTGSGLCVSPEMTTIRSYPFKGLTWNGWMQFRIDQLNAKQQLCDATLRLHFSTRRRAGLSTHAQTAGPPLLVRVEVMEHTLDPLSNSGRFSTRKVIAQSHVVSRRRATGWLRVNMSVAFKRSTDDLTKRFEIRLHVLGGHPGSIEISTNIAGHHSPLLVLFTHEQPDKSNELIFDQLTAGKHGHFKDENSTAGLITVLARSARSVHVPPPAVETCNLKGVLINMADIGLSAVVQPRRFNMTYCTGHCYHVIPAAANPNRHGQLLSLLHSFGRRPKHQVPAPCCGPTQLTGIDLMYWTRTGALAIKYHRDLIVEQCGCW